MKTTFYVLLTSFLLIIACKYVSQKDIGMETSCQRLLTLGKNNPSDTFLLRQILDSASVIAAQVSIKRHDSLFAVTSRLLGNQFFSTQSAQARDIYNKGLQIGRRQLAVDEDIIYRLYRNIALTYYRENDYKKALIYFDSVIITQPNAANQSINIDNQMNIAECYQSLGDFKAAQRIFEKVQDRSLIQGDSSKLANVYLHFAYCLRRLKTYEAATRKAQEGVTVLKKMATRKTLSNGDSTLLANCYYASAYVFQDSGAYKQAEFYYSKALTIYKKQSNWDDYKKGLSNMGIMYRFDKQFDKAEKTLTEGIALSNQNKLDDKAIRLKASFFVNRSEVYLETKQYKKALADHDSAIYFFTLYEKRPSLTAVMMQARPVLLSVLSDKAKVFTAFQENGADTEGYQKALKATQKIIELADDIRADYFSDDAKLTLANDIKPALERGIGVCQKLYLATNDKQYLHQAFGFVEYSRGMVLYENARLDNQLSSDLKTKNEELKKKEAALIAKNSVEDLQDYLRLKRQFRENIKKELKRNQLATVSDVQSALLKDDKTAFIEYFVGDSTIFVFSLGQNEIKLNASPTPKDFEQQIQNLRNEITQRKPVEDAAVFMQQANALYATLLEKTLAQTPTTINQLIIAPDGVLNYLPFDILIKGDPSVFLPNNKSGFGMSDVGKSKSSTNSSLTKGSSLNFQDCDFLLRHYTISYAYSANPLLEQKQVKKGRNPNLFAGFASLYDESDPRLIAVAEAKGDTTRGSSSDLKWAREEVKTISDLLGGDAFISDKSTETTFKKVANHYRILHFAMHGLVDNEDPALNKLLFTLTPKDTTNDNNLTAAELYTMPLNADLAVLGACNTGSGTLRKGEGVMSIARAFTYAGVPATVTSLWSVPDKFTNEIMVEFYKNLQKGMSKDAALRQSKLTYLDNASRSKEANPFFWAAFVPIGNMDAMDVDKKDPLSILGILAGLALISGFGFWFLKRKK